MRRFVGIVLILLAVITALAGAGLAILLGTDNRTTTGPHEIDTNAGVLVTRPDVLSWAGPTITLTVEVEPGQEIFVGAANAVDLADYVATTHRTEVTDFRPPWDIATEDVPGENRLAVAPGNLDWWVTQAVGTGSATLSVELPEQAFALAVIAIGGGDLEGMRVTTAYDLDGGFGIGLGMVGFAVGLGLFGWIALQGRPMVRAGDEEADEAEYAEEGRR